MVEVVRNALVAYSAEQMFELVNDVACYPEFLKGCSGTEVHEQSEQHMLATLHLYQGPISLDLTTRNTLSKGQSIEMFLEKGPLKSLQGIWTFNQLGTTGSKVELKLNFETGNKLLGGGFSLLLSKMGADMVDAFCKRAEQVYG